MFSIEYGTDPKFLGALGGLVRNSIHHICDSFEVQNIQ